MNKKQLLEEALVRIERINNHIQNFSATTSFIQNLDKYKYSYIKIDTGNVRELLYDAELSEWQHLFMWGLIATEKDRQRIKAMAYERFLDDGMAVAHWFNNGRHPGRWLKADEDDFRAMIKEEFFSNKE